MNRIEMDYELGRIDGLHPVRPGSPEVGRRAAQREELFRAYSSLHIAIFRDVLTRVIRDQRGRQYPTMREFDLGKAEVMREKNVPEENAGVCGRCGGQNFVPILITRLGQEEEAVAPCPRCNAACVTTDIPGVTGIRQAEGYYGRERTLRTARVMTAQEAMIALDVSGSTGKEFDPEIAGILADKIEAMS